MSAVSYQLWLLLEGFLITLVWSGLVAWFACIVANAVFGWRVSKEEESVGLDISSHGESAYHG